MHEYCGIVIHHCEKEVDTQKDMYLFITYTCLSNTASHRWVTYNTQESLVRLCCFDNSDKNRKSLILKIDRSIVSLKETLKWLESMDTERRVYTKKSRVFLSACLFV